MGNYRTEIHKKCAVCSVMSALHLQNEDEISFFQSQPQISDEEHSWTKLLGVP